MIGAAPVAASLTSDSRAVGTDLPRSYVPVSDCCGRAAPWHQERMQSVNKRQIHKNKEGTGDESCKRKRREYSSDEVTLSDRFPSNLKMV